MTRPGHNRRAPPRSLPTRRLDLTIERLGAQGDGVAIGEAGPIYVPLTLPGERVTADVEGDRGRLVEIITPAPNRAPPKCSHYGQCGGCSLQHMADADYLAFKREQVRAALATQRLDVEVEPAVSTPPRTRRRATFAAARRGKDVVVGFHGARAHAIVPIRDCAVLTPGLLAILPKLEQLAAIAAPPKDALAITVVETATGLDVAMTHPGSWFSAGARAQLVSAAAQMGLARVSLGGEVIMQARQPALRMGSAFLTPPPGGFLQASQPAESEMLRLVREAIGEPKSLIDLFSGSGTFTLPLAAATRVHAVETESAALEALTAALKTATGLKPVTIERRDLFKRPVMATELAKYDAVVIDPPRAGAEAQAKELAKAKASRMAFVSCNPMTLARDLRILVDGGWRIARVTPVDQFVWSAHTEVVAALSR